MLPIPEGKLKKLYSLTGDRKDMIKQIQNRADNLFMDVTQSSELNPNDLVSNLDYSKLTRKLFPDQLAITDEEKLALLKHDTLQPSACETSNSVSTG